TTLDPLARVREVKFDVWAGARPTAPRPASSAAPPALVGDGPRQSVTAAGRGGVYAADAPVPELAAGPFLWVQPVVGTAAGAPGWGAARASEFTQGMAVDRKEAKLEFKPPADGIERTLRMLSNSSTTLFRGDKSLTFSEKMDGYVLEHLFPDSRGLGTGIRL